MAQLLEVTVSTLYEWEKKYPEFSESIKKGKDALDCKVVNALLQRAIGYKFDETTEEYVFSLDAEGNEHKRLKSRKVVTKEIPPDTTAQIFWLINRQYEDWKKNGKDPVDNNNGIDTVDFNFIKVDKDAGKSED